MRIQPKYHCGYLREVPRSRRGSAHVGHLPLAANDNAQNAGPPAGAVTSVLVVLILATIEIATIAALMSAIADWDLYGL